ncbi:MAG: phosphonate ABC transporter, permease protein PhnE, partial [Betaproteobacteria bacterium]|nr:phosphonate ABC transporter, permease protein PhnE [Betaproteobacteria bacterium]
MLPSSSTRAADRLAEAPRSWTIALVGAVLLGLLIGSWEGADMRPMAL